MPTARPIGQDPAVIARLEVEAARRPRTFRAQLTLLAVAGDLALTVTTLLPWAAPIIIGTLFLDRELFYWLGGAAILFLAWVLRPSFRFEGRELRREEAPQLHEEIEALKRKLDAPVAIRVCLDASFNASATEARGLFGVAGTQCALTLGVPLLVGLSREQALAVVAHELGHFSRRHGRLGHWLYRAREGWLHYTQAVTDSDSLFDRAAAWYAVRFLRFFSPRSFVHSRRCEYEADADAAFSAGSGNCAQALTRIAVLGHLWQSRLPREIFDWQSASAEPPANFHALFSRFVAERPADELQAILDEELRAPSSWFDTHPSLAERLRALRERPNLTQPKQSAGELLLGNAWPGVLAEFDSMWAGEARPGWQIAHLRAKHIAGPLLAADAALANNWGVELRLARALELLRLDRAAGLRELKALHQANPEHKHVRYAHGAALLAADDAAGVGVLEALAKKDAAYRAGALGLVTGYYERRGDWDQVERWSAWHKRATQDLAQALTECVERAESGQAGPSTLSDAKKAIVAEAARKDPCIGGVWLIEARAELRSSSGKSLRSLDVHLLAISIDPAVMDRLKQSEDAIGGRYEGILQDLLPSDHAALVRTYFTTECPPAVYDDRTMLARRESGDAHVVQRG